MRSPSASRSATPRRLRPISRWISIRAAVLLALGDVALLALAGRRGQHPVLGGHPAAALAGHPARDGLLDRRRADHARAAAGDQRRAGRRAHEAGLDRHRPQLVRRPAAAARRADARSSRHLGQLGTAPRRARRGPSGSCRKRVPEARSASGSPDVRNRYSPSTLEGLPSPRLPSTCSTCRAIARAGADDLHAAAEHPLEHRPDQRVVRAAEDHRVDLRVAQRARVVADGVDDLARRTASRARSAARAAGRRRRPRSRTGPPPRSPSRTRRSAPSPRSPCSRRGRCGSRPRPAPRPGWTTPSTSTPERRLHQPLPQRGQRGRRGAVARHDEQLDPPRQQLLGDLERERLDLLARPRAVRHPRGVGEVDEVLVRQLHEQLVQHREPADPGIEHADGPTAQRVGRGRGHWRRDHAASLAGRPDPPPRAARPLERRRDASTSRQTRRHPLTSSRPRASPRLTCRR